jgi:hypothetical protein
LAGKSIVLAFFPVVAINQICPLNNDGKGKNLFYIQKLMMEFWQNIILKCWK